MEQKNFNGIPLSQHIMVNWGYLDQYINSIFNGTEVFESQKLVNGLNHECYNFINAFTIKDHIIKYIDNNFMNQIDKNSYDDREDETYNEILYDYTDKKNKFMTVLDAICPDKIKIEDEKITESKTQSLSINRPMTPPPVHRTVFFDMMTEELGLEATMDKFNNKRYSNKKDAEDQIIPELCKVIGIVDITDVYYRIPYTNTLSNIYGRIKLSDFKRRYSNYNFYIPNGEIGEIAMTILTLVLDTPLLKYNTITYEPWRPESGGNPAEKGVLNLFQGYPYQIQPDKTITDYEKLSEGTQRILWHFKNVLAGGEEKYYWWLLAHFRALLTPKAKTGVCLVMAGEPGCGKSIIYQELLSNLIGHKNCLMVDKLTNITNHFNEEMINAQSITIGELTVGSQDWATTWARLKYWITDSLVTVNRKGKVGIMIQNYWNFIALTNTLLNSVPLNEDNYRKYMVLVAKSLIFTSNEIDPVKQKEDIAIQRHNYYAWLHWAINKDTVLQEFLNYLMSYTPPTGYLTDLNMLDTPYARILLEQNKSSSIDFVEELLSGNALIEYFKIPDDQMAAVPLNIIKKDKNNNPILDDEDHEIPLFNMIISTSTMYRIYTDRSKKLGAFCKSDRKFQTEFKLSLEKLGIKYDHKKTRVNGKSLQCYTIKNIAELKFKEKEPYDFPNTNITYDQ